MHRYLVGLALTAVPGVLAAQPEPSSETVDKTVDKAVDETIIILGQVVAEDGPLATRHNLSADTLAAAAPKTVADIASLLPATNVRTNSRGETLAFIRAAGERETAVFLDGAPLTVPWDNRVDLQSLPAGVAAGASVVSGPVSARYGARASGGAIELQSVRASRAMGALSVEAGEQGLYRLNGLGAGKTAGLSWSFAAGRQGRSGVPVPETGALPFSQDASGRRTNTDQVLTSGFGRVSYRLGSYGFGASILVSNGERGVQPESKRNPATQRVRFWRYPETAFRLVSASVERRRGNGGESRFLGWTQIYDQTIESFESDAYARLEDRQRDENTTLGGRATHRLPLGEATLILSASGHISTHDQLDMAFAPAGDVVNERAVRFREALLVVGGEANIALSPALDLALSVSVDRLSILEAAGDGTVEPFFDVSFGAGLSWQATPKLSLRAAAGRRPRQPSLRELFGEGVDRFVPNANLTSERSWAGEAGAAWQGRGLRVEATAFLRDTQDSLAQRSVEVAGETLLQRFNRAGALVTGVELVADGDAAAWLTWHANLTWQRARGADGERLPERPRLIGRGWVDYEAPLGFGLRAEVEHIGEAFSPDADGRLNRLDAATLLNLQASWRPEGLWREAPEIELYLRADNVTDAFLEPQLGLPAPGRWVRGGLRTAF